LGELLVFISLTWQEKCTVWLGYPAIIGFAKASSAVPGSYLIVVYLGTGYIYRDFMMKDWNHD
jgi:hypothetical protein